MSEERKTLQTKEIGPHMAASFEKWKTENIDCFNPSTIDAGYLYNRLWLAFMRGGDSMEELYASQFKPSSSETDNSEYPDIPHPHNLAKVSPAPADVDKPDFESLARTYAELFKTGEWFENIRIAAHISGQSTIIIEVDPLSNPFGSSEFFSKVQRSAIPKE